MRNFKVEMDAFDDVIEADNYSDAVSRAMLKIQDMLEAYEGLMMEFAEEQRELIDNG